MDILVARISSPKRCLWTPTWLLRLLKNFQYIFPCLSYLPSWRLPLLLARYLHRWNAGSRRVPSETERIAHWMMMMIRGLPPQLKQYDAALFSAANTLQLLPPLFQWEEHRHACTAKEAPCPSEKTAIQRAQQLRFRVFGIFCGGLCRRFQHTYVYTPPSCASCAWNFYDTDPGHFGRQPRHAGERWKHALELLYLLILMWKNLYRWRKISG